MNTMIRTQVYLTEEEKNALEHLARRSGTSFSATLREAVDSYIRTRTTTALSEAVEATFGLWKDRPTPATRQLRAEWEARSRRLEAQEQPASDEGDE